MLIGYFGRGVSISCIFALHFKFKNMAVRKKQGRTRAASSGIITSRGPSGRASYAGPKKYFSVPKKIGGSRYYTLVNAKTSETLDPLFPSFAALRTYARQNGITVVPRISGPSIK
jgi:hypothetical protein